MGWHFSVPGWYCGVRVFYGQPAFCDFIQHFMEQHGQFNNDGTSIVYIHGGNPISQ